MEYQKKRLRYGLSINALVLFSFNLFCKDETMPCVYNFDPVVKNLRMQKIVSLSRLLVIPAIVAITLYFNKNKVIENIENHPIPFAFASYFLGNCLIDSISKYSQIDQTLEFFLFSQTMSRYLLCILAIKNSMKRFDAIKVIKFDEQKFFSIVANSTGHTVQELEILTEQLLNSSIHSMDNLCIEEKLYCMCKEQITIEQMLLVCKDDTLIYQELVKFYENPEKEYESILVKMCILISQHFNYFIKKKLHNF
jgi:hypothetical protein